MFCLSVKGGDKTPKNATEAFEQKWSSIEKEYSKELLALAESVKQHKDVAALLIKRGKEVAHDEGEFARVEKEMGAAAGDGGKLYAAGGWVKETLWPGKALVKCRDIIISGGKEKEFAKPATRPKDDLKDFAGDLEKLQKKTAQEFFKLAGDAFKWNSVGKAYNAAKTVFEYDAHHKKARIALGHKYYKKIWLTMYEVGQIKRKLIKTPKWGWVSKGARKGLEKDLFPYKGKFMKKAQYLEMLKSAWENAETFESQNFILECNAGLESAVEVLKLAEQHYENFFVIFASVWLPGKRNISSGFIPKRKKKFRIKFTADYETYKKIFTQLTGNPPPSDAAGYFCREHGSCCLWKMEGGSYGWQPTLIHEVTHQIIDDNGRQKPPPGKSGNGWAQETLAIYMEFVEREPDGSCNLPAKSIRIQNAKTAKSVGVLKPLKEIFGLKFDKFEEECNKSGGAKLYGQAAAMAKFFLEYEDGKYRQAFLEFLRQYYYGSSNPNLLVKLTGVNVNTLNKQFTEWLDTL
jgi:hypothetical protein